MRRPHRPADHRWTPVLVPEHRLEDRETNGDADE